MGSDHHDIMQEVHHCDEVIARSVMWSDLHLWDLELAGFLLAGGALYYILGELVPNAVRLEKSSRPSAANSAQSM